MDGSAKEIVFDEDGICNFCHMAQKELKAALSKRDGLEKVIKRIKKDGKGKKYDVLMGLSGGVDSSMALHNIMKLGLRPLCYAIDNGYHKRESDENIMRLVEGLKVPFFRYTIDLNKFRELQSSFIKAGLINIEIPTDHIILASGYELVKQYGIKWIVSGGNVATESIMPASWSYTARDLVHIKDVYEKVTKKKLSGIPVCSLWKFNVYKWWHRVKTVYILDYLDYNRQASIEFLAKEYGYEDYGEKHCENTFTWWYQNYYLFEKFGIDKRKAHLSSLINSGQLTREEALEELGKNPIYPTFGIEEKVKGYAKHEHSDFKTDEVMFRRISKVVLFLRKFGIGRVNYLGT